MFSSRSFMALAVTFRTSISFELIFTVWSKVQLHFCIHFCMWQFNWFSTTCWRDYSFTFGWYWYLCRKSIGNMFVKILDFQFYFIDLHLYPCISTTLSWLALLCSKLWNQAVYLVFKIVLTVTNMGSFTIPYEF